MIALLRSEWIKLRTVRSNITIAFVALMLPLAITLLSLAFLNTTDINSDTLPQLLTGPGTIATLLIGVIGVMCVTQEYSQGTIRLTFAATPGRPKVYLAKALLMALVGLALTGIIIGVGNVAGRSIMSARDLSSLKISTEAGSAYLAMILMGGLLGLLGLAIGSITRNPPGAVATLLLWPLLVENLVGALLRVIFGRWITDWLPFQTGLSAVQLDGGMHEMHQKFSRFGSIGYFALWVVGVTLIAERMMKRRDA